MSQGVEHTFRTKTGACTITPDQIVLTRQGTRGAIAQSIFGDSIVHVRLIYGVIGLAWFAVGVWLLLEGHTVVGVFQCVFGIFFLWIITTTRNVSAAPTIDRKAIQTVIPHPPQPPAKRGYFVVWFNENGKVRKRLIILPGSKDNGQEEYKRAERRMRDAGLLREP